MTSFDTVVVSRLYRVIADQIASKIRAGEFIEGQRLPSERELADQLGVSRASVREALIALELEGYVDVRVGSGVFVLQSRKSALSAGGRRAPRPPLPDIGPFDLLETRLLLEPECAALAAQWALPAQRDAMQAAHANMLTGTSPRAHDHAFHLSIARACGNAALELAISHIWSLSLNNPVFDRLDKHFVTAKVWQQAEVEHGVILQAILDKDGHGARHAMHDHLVGILARLREDFGRNGSL